MTTVTACRVTAAVTYEVPRMLTKGRAYFVDAGQRLRLDCQFQMDTFNLFDNPVVWIKTQLDDRTQMNMMGNLVEPFESTQRFRVTFEAQRPDFTLGLLIEGNTVLPLQPLITIRNRKANRSPSSICVRAGGVVEPAKIFLSSTFLDSH